MSTSSGSSASATRARLAEALHPVLADSGFDLEDVMVSKAGSRSLVRVVVDRDGGVDLDGVADASRAVGNFLDADEDLVPGAYVLEVTSPGVDRPLTAPRHWRRNAGRLVAVTPREGKPFTGRILEADERAAVLDTDKGQQTVRLADVAKALIQVEFSRAGQP
jgi:ribosome maturation factor RimP